MNWAEIWGGGSILAYVFIVGGLILAFVLPLPKR